MEYLQNLSKEALIETIISMQKSQKKSAEENKKLRDENARLTGRLGFI